MVVDSVTGHDSNVTECEFALQSVTANRKVLARRLRQGGFTYEEAQAIASRLCDNSHLEQALVEIERAYKQSANKALSERLNEWIVASQGYWSVTECDKELQIVTAEAKSNRRQILHRLRQQGVIERHTGKEGVYRKVEVEAPPIEWEYADISNTFPIHWPFELEDYVTLYPKNIVVVAGNSNAGKTAFLLNVVRLNMERYMCRYLSSEMAAEELKRRLMQFEEEKWAFDPRERSSNYADAIIPDGINIIDYMEIAGGEWYRIADEIRAIFDKLKKGIAIIAVQKKGGSELGRGAEFSLEKSRLYLSIDDGLLKIVKAKNWASEQNPNGLEFPFKLVKGAKFVQSQIGAMRV